MKFAWYVQDANEGVAPINMHSKTTETTQTHRPCKIAGAFARKDTGKARSAPHSLAATLMIASHPLAVLATADTMLCSSPWLTRDTSISGPLVIQQSIHADLGMCLM